MLLALLQEGGKYLPAGKVSEESFLVPHCVQEYKAGPFSVLGTWQITDLHSCSKILCLSLKQQSPF